jgi:hypothetical protein
LVVTFLVDTSGNKVEPNAETRDKGIVEAAEHGQADQTEHGEPLPEGWKELGRQHAEEHEGIRRMISEVLEEKLHYRFQALEARLDALLSARL